MRMVEKLVIFDHKYDYYLAFNIKTSDLIVNLMQSTLDKMKKDGMIESSDVMQIPVIHGKKTILPLEEGELLHFYQQCHYSFFRLTDKVRNVNIDLLCSELQDKMFTKNEIKTVYDTLITN